MKNIKLSLQMKHRRIKRKIQITKKKYKQLTEIK